MKSKITLKKKNIISIVAIAFFSILNVNAQINKAAIISIFGNKNLSDDPMNTLLFEALLKDSSFDISGTVIKFEKIIDEKMIPIFSFPFMNKNDVVSNPDYKMIKSTLMITDDEKESHHLLNPYVSGEGYKNIAAFGIVNDKKAIAKCFEIFPDVDAVMIAYINYNLYDAAGAMGLSSKKVYAYCNIKMFNKFGKRIFKLKERATSNSGVMGVGGIVVDPKKLKPMVYEASEKLLIDMESKIEKSVSKMAKKLAKQK